MPSDASFAKHRNNGICYRNSQKRRVRNTRMTLVQIAETLARDCDPERCGKIEGTLTSLLVYTRKNEGFYQAVLEKRYSGAHMRLATGQTDITTDTMHIEIKRAHDWLEGLRQLLSYNMMMEKRDLRLYLFNYSDLSRARRNRLMSVARENKVTPVSIYILDQNGDEELLFDGAGKKMSALENKEHHSQLNMDRSAFAEMVYTMFPLDPMQGSDKNDINFAQTLIQLSPSQAPRTPERDEKAPQALKNFWSLFERLRRRVRGL